MRILIIGNGFDVEHGLKTSYIDFLEFSKWFICTFEEKDNSSFAISEHISNRYKQLKKENPTLLKELYGTIHRNIWLSYFERMKKVLGQNWIDFESEISKILSLLESAKIDYSDNANFYTSIIDPSKYFIEFYSIFYGMEYKERKVSQKVFDGQQEKLLKALKKLTRALEIYLSYWVEEMEITKMNPDIIGVRPDNILSFNYTHTFDKIYGKSAGGIEYSYIHGETKSNSSVDDCKMVLGVDDCISWHDENDTSEYFIAFKKYYQRLDKETDTKYRTWVDEIKKNKEKKHEVFVFGHSLDITDQGVLAPIFELENVKVTVFYHSKEKRSELIANMIRLIKKENVEKKIHNGTLLFRKQSASSEISNSELEIKSDIQKLSNVLTMSFSDISSLIGKIEKKIKQHDVKYFINLSYVITVVDWLCIRNLWTDAYQADVEKIIEDIIDNGECLLLDRNRWMNADDLNGFYVRPITEKFINFANSRINLPEDNLVKQIRLSIGKSFSEMNVDEYLKAFSLLFENCRVKGRFDGTVLDALLVIIFDNVNVANKAKDKLLEECAEDSDETKMLMIFSAIIQGYIDTVYMEQQYADVEQVYKDF